MRTVIYAFRCWLYDISRVMKYILKKDMWSESRCLAKIRLRVHVVEKGLCMPDMRPAFGKDNILELASLCERYAAFGYDRSRQGFVDAVSVLGEYGRVHRENGYALDADVTEALGRVAGLATAATPVASLTFGPDDYFRNASDFGEFASSRHSVRDFAGTEVPDSVIREAVRIAVTAPSACNRQSVRVRVASGDALKEIASMHRGSRGFGDKADKLLLLTVDLACYFGLGERNLPYTDAGIFAMNLLYGLHSQGVAACALNWCVTPKEDKRLHTRMGIPRNEMVTLVVACGNVPDREFKVPASPRLSVDEILKF